MTLVFGDRGADGEIPQVMLIQGDDVRGKIVWIQKDRERN
jgi:hypothetical protein